MEVNSFLVLTKAALLFVSVLYCPDLRKTKFIVPGL